MPRSSFLTGFTTLEPMRLEEIVKNIEPNDQENDVPKAANSPK